MSAESSYALDAILPLGKPGAAVSNEIAELVQIHQRPLIDWAVDEALQAGASRILLVAPVGYRAAGEILAAVQACLAAQSGKPGQDPVQAVLLLRKADGPEGWDGLIRTAASRCTGSRALLIDPAMLLVSGRQIVTSTAFMLRRTDLAGGTMAPILALANASWEDAVHLPVVDGLEGMPDFRFDRGGETDTLPVFAGRALLHLPLPEPEDCAASPWPISYRFPFETMIRVLNRQSAQAFALTFEPLDCGTNPKAQALRSFDDMSVPRRLRLTTRVGLSALERAD